MCTGCGRQIPMEYNVCPHCGRAQNAPGAPVQQAQQGSVGSGLTILLYILSFLIPILGIIIGILWLGMGSDPEKKQVGKMCLILGILSIVIWIVVGCLIGIGSLWATGFY